jgi:hypothetical protein
MEFKDYYKIMEITPQATEEEIRQSFRRLARKYHPDVSDEADATDRFKEIREAYEILKDPQKRESYDNSKVVIKPYSLPWFRTKKESWDRYRARNKATQNARDRANMSEEGNSYFPIVLSFFVLIGLVASVGYFLFWPNYNPLPKLPNDVVVASNEAEKSLIGFFIDRPDTDLIQKLSEFNRLSKDNVFEHEHVKKALITHYNNEIDKALQAEDFDKAIQSFNAIKNQYPNSDSLSNKYNVIKTQFNKKRVALDKAFEECVYQVQILQLEEAPCAGDVWQSVKKINLKAELPNATRLNSVYEKAMEYALSQENYVQAEQLLEDWRKLIPERLPQRGILSNTLKYKKLVFDLSHAEGMKMTEMLNQFEKLEESIRVKILQVPEVQQNIFHYHEKGIGALSEAQNVVTDGKMPIMDNTEISLSGETVASGQSVISEQAAISGQESSPLPQGSTEKVALLLTECPTHYEARRLTAGERTVLGCYREVLAIDPENALAKQGLKDLENRFISWTENAIRNKSSREKIDGYIRSLGRVNPQSTALTQLKIKAKNLEREIAASKPLESTEESIKPESAVEVVKESTQSVSEFVPAQESAQTERCMGCDCDKLLGLMSIGVNPLTQEQKDFYNSECR